MMNRCLNSLWGYCDTEPEIKMVYEETVVSGLGGISYIQQASIPRCKLSHATCGHYVHFTDIVNQQLNSAAGKSHPDKVA